jgi:hypothetical protein
VPALLQIHLELDLRVEPMVGRMSSGDGPVHAFTGWTGLAAALDRVTAAERATDTIIESEEDPHVP